MSTATCRVFVFGSMSQGLCKVWKQEIFYPTGIKLGTLMDGLADLLPWASQCILQQRLGSYRISSVHSLGPPSGERRPISVRTHSQLHTSSSHQLWRTGTMSTISLSRISTTDVGNKHEVPLLKLRDQTRTSKASLWIG